MRDYLYIWSNPEDQYIVASGIEFKDLAKAMSYNSLWFFEQYFDHVDISWPSGFAYASKEKVQKKLIKEDVYSWGDFSWADSVYEGDVEISRLEVAEMAYFKQTSEPFGVINLPSIGNKFLVRAHDDGWFLKMYYNTFKDMSLVLRKMEISPKIVKRLEKGEGAFYIDKHVKLEVEKTMAIDTIQKKIYDMNL